MDRGDSQWSRLPSPTRLSALTPPPWTTLWFDPYPPTIRLPARPYVLLDLSVTFEEVLVPVS
jgi:hypothetical protein